jgi:hypothetical protein
MSRRRRTRVKMPVRAGSLFRIDGALVPSGAGVPIARIRPTVGAFDGHPRDRHASPDTQREPRAPSSSRSLVKLARAGESNCVGRLAKPAQAANIRKSRAISGVDAGFACEV